jgi:hypothetical protein
MASLEQLKRDRDALSGDEEVLSNLLRALRSDRRIATDAAYRFQLDQQIKEKTDELNTVYGQIDALQQQIDAAEQQASGLAQGAVAALSGRTFPGGQAFQRARQKIDAALMMDEKRRLKVLRDIHYYLEQAEREEGGEQAAEPVRYFIRYERARLIYLQGNYADADREFDEMYRFFINLANEAMLREIEEFRICLELQNLLSGLAGQGNSARMRRARAAVEQLQQNMDTTRSPLVWLLVQLIKQITISPLEELTANVLGDNLEAIQNPPRPPQDDVFDKEMLREQLMQEQRKYQRDERGRE